MEEIVIGTSDFGSSCTTACEPNDGLCRQADCVCNASGVEGLTVVDVNTNVQDMDGDSPLDADGQNDDLETIFEDKDECERREDGIITVNSELLCGDCQPKEPVKEDKSFSAVEFVSPDDGDKLNHSGRKLFNNNKANIKQVIAKVELRIKYYDGHETHEVVIPAGTRGGYISENADFDGSWISEDSIVLGVSLSNCYVEDSVINSDGYLCSSYIKKCRCSQCLHIEIYDSSLSTICLKGSECYVSNSHLYDGTVENSSIKRSDWLCSFEIVDSKIENARNVNNLIVDGAGISNSNNDLLQVTNVGTANRTLCAYKTPKGGVRVSTGCFRGTLDELIMANARTHLGYNKSDDGYLIKGNSNVNRRDEWCYTEYDMLIKYIKHHFKLDVNTMTISTKY